MSVTGQHQPTSWMAIIGLVSLTLGGCFDIVEGGPEPAGDLSVTGNHYHSPHVLRVHEDGAFELAPAGAPILCRGTLSQTERSAWRRVLQNYREDDDGVTILPGRHASFTPEGGERWRRLQEPPDELMRFIDDFVQGIPNRPNTTCEAATSNWTIELSVGVDYDAWQEARVIRLSAEEFVQQSERNLIFDPYTERPPFEPCDDGALGSLRNQVATDIEQLAERSMVELGEPSRWWNNEPLELSPNVILSHYVTYLTTESHLADFPEHIGRRHAAIFAPDEAFVRTLVNAALEHCPAPE